MKLLLIVILSALPLACASDVFAQRKPIGAEEGCDTACRAARNNPKPNFVSPEVSLDGKVTVRVYAPKANSIGIGGLEPLNENGESEVAAAKKNEDGIWTYVSPARSPGTYAYFVRIDGVDALDPSNLYVVHGRLRLQNIVEIGDGEDFARYDPNIPHGSVGEVFYRTPGFEFNRRMRVYTPPGYGLKQEMLPVLFLLHGGGGSEHSWQKLGRVNFILDKLIAEGRAKRMLAVMIDGYVDDFKRFSGVHPDLTTDDIQKGTILHSIKLHGFKRSDASCDCRAVARRGASDDGRAQASWRLQLRRRVQLRSISNWELPQGDGGDEDRSRLASVWRCCE